MQLFVVVSLLVSLFTVECGAAQLAAPDTVDVTDEVATSSAVPKLVSVDDTCGGLSETSADITAADDDDDDATVPKSPPQPPSIVRRGQHLLLVPRGSLHALQLEAVTAYRLRQSQQALRVKEDNRDSVPVNMDGNMVDVKLPQVARDEAETESTGAALYNVQTQRPTNQTKSLVGPSPGIATTAAASNSNEDAKSHHPNEEDEFETIPLLLTGLHDGMVIMSRSHRQDEDDLVRYYEKDKAAKRGGFMMLGNGQDARFRYIDLSVGEMDSEGTGSVMGKDKVVHVRLWNTKQAGVSSSSSSSSSSSPLPHECWSRHQFQLQSMRNTTVVNRTTTAIFMSETVQAGAPVFLGWSPTMLNENEQCTPVLGVNVGAASHQRWQFVIHADGSISPIGAEHLVIGLAPRPELMLVHRQGQSRATTSSNSSTTSDTTGSGTAFAAATTTSTQTLFFHNIHALWSQNPAPVHGTPMRLFLSPQSTSPVDGNGAASANDNDSHSLVPLYSVDNTSSYNAFGIWDMQRLGVSSSAINATEEEKSVIYLHALAHRQPFEFLLHDNDGRLLVPLSLHVERGVPVRLIQYNGSAMFHTDMGRMLDTAVLAWSGNATWIVHDDGSISPRNAPYLALGCACGSSTRASSGSSSSMSLSPVSNTSRLAAAETTTTTTTTTEDAAQRAQQLERLYAAGILSRQHSSEGSFSNSNHHSEYHNETHRAQNSRVMALFVKHALQPQVLLALHELLALFGTNWTAAGGGDSSSTSSESGSSASGGSGSSSSSGSATTASTTDDSLAHVGYAIMWFASLMGVVLTLLAIKRIPWILWGIPIVWLWFGAKFVVAYLSGVCVVWCYTAYKRRRTKRSRLVAPTVAVQGVLPPAAAPAADNEVDLRLLE